MNLRNSGIHDNDILINKLLFTQKVLEFYADSENYKSSVMYKNKTPVEVDNGFQAKHAIETLKIITAEYEKSIDDNINVAANIFDNDNIANIFNKLDNL